MTKEGPLFLFPILTFLSPNQELQFYQCVPPLPVVKTDDSPY